MKIQLHIRPALLEDFYNGIPKNQPGHSKYIGVFYFLLNASDQMEVYRTTTHTNWSDLGEFIKLGRCFVLDKNTDENFNTQVTIIER